MLNEQAEAVKPARQEHKRRRANKKKAEKRKRKSQTKLAEQAADADASPVRISPEVVLGAAYSQREDKKLSEEETDTYLLGVIMHQFSLKKGLKEFGDRGRRRYRRN